MKTKIFSVVIGLINGGFLASSPLMLYDFVLTKNLDIPEGTDFALQGALGMIFLVLIINILAITLIYRLNVKESPKTKVFLLIFVGWIIAVISLTFLKHSDIFREGETNIGEFFYLLCIIINFISIIISTLIGKLVIKIIAKKNRA